MDELENETGIDVSDLDVDLQVAYHLRTALDKLHEARPNNRSQLDKRFAITSTELEKVIAYYDYYVMRHDPDDQ